MCSPKLLKKHHKKLKKTEEFSPETSNIGVFR
jgi:hypothetical protein